MDSYSLLFRDRSSRSSTLGTQYLNFNRSISKPQVNKEPNPLQETVVTPVQEPPPEDTLSEDKGSTDKPLKEKDDKEDSNHEEGTKEEKSKDDKAENTDKETKGGSDDISVGS